MNAKRRERSASTIRSLLVAEQRGNETRQEHRGADMASEPMAGFLPASTLSLEAHDAARTYISHDQLNRHRKSFTLATSHSWFLYNNKQFTYTYLDTRSSEITITSVQHATRQNGRF